MKTETLREQLGDYNRVERALGRDTVENIVRRERMMEQAEKERKGIKWRKLEREGR